MPRIPGLRKAFAPGFSISPRLGLFERHFSHDEQQSAVHGWFDLSAFVAPNVVKNAFSALCNFGAGTSLCPAPGTSTNCLGIPFEEFPGKASNRRWAGVIGGALHSDP